MLAHALLKDPTNSANRARYLASSAALLTAIEAERDAATAITMQQLDEVHTI